MMEESLQQNKGPEAVPWSIGDIAKGAVVAIAAVVIIGIALGVCMIVLIGTTNLQDLASQHLTSAELLKQIVNTLEANGRLNIALIILFIFMILGEGAIPLGAWLFSVRKYRCRWEALGFKKFDIKKGLLLAIIITCIGLGIAIGYEALLGTSGTEDSYNIYSPFTANGIGIALFAITAVIVAPVAEETFFRGFMLQGIGKRLGYTWGTVISSALFALAHISPTNLVPIFILGLMLAWLYNKTKSIWPCIIVHCIYNSIALVFMIIS